MDEEKIYKRLPNFKTQEEENKFWEAHDMTEYTTDPNVPAYYIQTKNKDRTFYMYAENPTIDDPKLTEMVNVRFDKRTVDDLRILAEDDDRTMASLIRRWVMQKLKEEKYNRNG